MIRLIGSLILFAIMAGGYLYFDFRMSAKWAGREDAEGLTFQEYVSGLTGRVAGLTGAANAAGMPTKLGDMLPKPPEGWTVRAAVPEDVKPFLPKSTKNADRKAMASLEKVVAATAGSGTESVTLAYERGDQTVLIKAVRYPNVIFTSLAAMQQRMELQMVGPEFRGTEFMTVRGLDVTEDLLPEGFRGRLFLADVGAQIHLRVLAPKRMKDTELVPFFQTLHVEAMNASVIDKVEGLGKVPVIVLASAMDQAEREAYLAERDARAAAEAEREATERVAAEEAGAADSASSGGGGGFLGGLFGGGGEAKADPAPEEAGKEITCKTGKDGVKRCTVGAD